MKWQPIETAPRDENYPQNILLFEPRGPRGIVDVGFFDSGKWWSATNHDGYEHSELDPTHWQPLPEPPEVTE